MRWVKGCCPKVDEGAYNEYGAYVTTGKIGNQKVTTDFHAENHAIQKAYREAVANGEIDKILDITIPKDFA